MKLSKWQILTGILLISLSLLFYFLHYFIFRDTHQIFLYLITDIAFLFIQVLVVGIIIDHLLTNREKDIRMEKLNMVIGIFYSEIGNKFLYYFSKYDPNINLIENELVVTKKWKKKEFQQVRKRLKQYNFHVEVDKTDFIEIHDFLVSKSDFLLRVLENPTLLEHESFTDLLKAIYHLTEELKFRENIQEIPATDHKHLMLDMERVYPLIMLEWLNYLEYLENNYPYLFSLALRTNPFDKDSSVIVMEN
jgi:hypothetical protein